MLQTENSQRLAPRKTWKQYNGSCSLVLKLRYRLAEEGCSQSQVSIARNLLSESVEDPSSAEVAVSYLLRAAEQSDPDGLQLLEECYRSGHGITDRNRGHVESCLGKSEAEKAAHRVGRQIFDSVTLDGSATLNETVFRQRLSDGNCLTADVDLQPRVEFCDIITSVKNCVKGCSPTLSITSKEPYSQRLRYLESLIFDCAIALSPFQMWANLFLTVLCSLLIYTLAYEPAVIIILQYEPLILCYMSFALAVACTAQLQYHKERGKNFAAWTDLVSKFDDTVVKRATRHRFQLLLRARLLLTYFVLVAGLCIFTSQTRYINFIIFSRSDLAVAAAVIFICVLYSSFVKSRAKIGIVASLFILVSTDLYASTCRLLSVAPETFWHRYLCWSMTAFKIFLYCHIGFRDGCIAAVQHFTCIVWLYTCQHLMQNCALEDFLLPICSVVLWTVIRKYVKHVHSTVLILAARLFQLHSWMKVGFCCCIWYFIYKSITAGTMKLKSILTSNWKKTAPLVLCTLLAMVASKLYYTTEELSLHLDRYTDLCRGSDWEDSNMAAMQQACAPFAGVKTHFVGHVTSVEIVHTRNVPEVLLSALPRSVQAVIACAIGKRWPTCHKTFQSKKDFAMCQLYRDVRLPACHLSTWNVYRFEIGVTVESGFDVKLVTDSVCQDFVALLKEGSKIDVTGRLMSGVEVPRVELLHATSESVTCNGKPELLLDWMSYFAAFVTFLQFMF